MPESTSNNGIPPVIREDVDKNNIRDGRRILWFQEPGDGCFRPYELRYLKIRGRRALPPISFFNNPTFDVLAVETAATWEKPIGGGCFMRRVATRPKTSPLVANYCFQPGEDDAVKYLFGIPADHIEARNLQKATGSL